MTDGQAPPGETDKLVLDRAEREVRHLLGKLEPIARGRSTVVAYRMGEWLPAVALNVTARTVVAIRD